MSAVDRYMQQRQAIPVSSDEVEPVYGLPTLTTLSPAAPEQQQATPDLLHPEPCQSIDHRAARKALEFAFTAGDSAGVASGALTTAAGCESRFQPDAFAGELFIDELIEGVLRFELEGRKAPLAKDHLRRLLCQPPASREVVRFRHEVLRELHGSAPLLQALETVYGKLVKLLQLFDESSGQSRYDLPRWRLDLLSALRELFESMHGPFEHARSGLARLHAFSALVLESKGFAELRGLLDFEGDMARVDLHLQVGVDGRVRKLDILKLEEHRTEPFYRGPIVRLVSRIVTFLRGYRFGNVELVERWFEHVYLGLLEYLPPVLQLRGDLEFYLSACHFAKSAGEKGLSVCIPELLGDDASAPRKLEALFNPLLMLQERLPVPCTLEVDSLRRSCIVTGPNSGGKTRLLQAIALTQMLGQSGFFVPAQSAQLRPASGLYVSLGNETSAGQQEGRLGTELLRIRHLFEHARPGSMIVLDELCSGTNPSEGEEIFQLVVGLLRELEPEVFITTHFLQFAQQLAEDADRLALCFVQVELDAERVPTYQFLPGVAETSLAQQTAARLGVSRDELLALIRRHRRD